jgi:urease gamma subunit
MHYTPREVRPFKLLHQIDVLITHEQVEKIVFSQAGHLAQRRLAKGVRLNCLEAKVRTRSTKQWI